MCVQTELLSQMTLDVARAQTGCQGFLQPEMLSDATHVHSCRIHVIMLY